MKTLSERYYDNEELTQEERRKIDAGNIRLNKAKCKKCNDIIQSTHRHDYKRCKCGAIAVDGGSWYIKRVGDFEAIEEMSECYKDIEK